MKKKHQVTARIGLFEDNGVDGIDCISSRWKWIGMTTNDKSWRRSEPEAALG